MMKRQIGSAITGCVAMLLSIPTMVSCRFIPVSEYVAVFGAFGCLGVGFVLWSNAWHENALLKRVVSGIKMNGERNEQ